MSQTVEGIPMETLQKELAEIKSEQKLQSARINRLEHTANKHDMQIVTLNEKLNKIDENTTWIKRKISGAIITAICTGVIGAAITVIVTAVKGGL